MPSKKRKYEARFPPARIKKIMQTDEEIGKVAAAVPVIISRSLEIFLQSLVETTAQYTNERKAKTMTTSHLKHCIESEGKFDFLKDLVANIADIANEEDDGGEPGDKPKKQRKPRQTNSEKKKKKKESSSEEDSDAQSDGDETGSAQRSFPSSPNPSDDILPDDIPPINIPPIDIPPISISLDPMPKHSVLQSASMQNSSLSPRSGQEPPHGMQSPKHTQITHAMSPHGMHSPKHIQVTRGMSPQRNAQYSYSHEVLQSPECPPQVSLSSCDLHPPVTALSTKDADSPMDTTPMIPMPSLDAPSLDVPSHLHLHAPSQLHAAPSSQNATSLDAPPCVNMPSPLNVPLSLNTPCLNASSSVDASSSLEVASSLKESSSMNAISSINATCPNMSLSLNLTSSLNAPSSLNMSSINTTSSLIESPNMPSSLNAPTSLNVPSPILSSPINAVSRNAPSPIYMPDEQLQSINQSNVTDRSQLCQRTSVSHGPRHKFQDPVSIPAATTKLPSRSIQLNAPIPQVDSSIPPQDGASSRSVVVTKLPPRPSHSIDSIMGNISSGPSQHQQRPDQQPSQKSTISSNFMPNFNLHGNGTSVPSISTSFRMNFPSSFKVANDDEDDYDT